MCAAFAAAVLTASAADPWPQFRGPRGDGVSAATGLPVVWSEGHNIRWKSALPGEGHSSPVIRDREIWLTTALDAGRSRNVLSIDFETGAVTRNLTLFTVDKPETIHRDNSYATPTPVLDGDRVYVNFGAAGTACLSATTGETLWQRSDIHLTYFDVGPASSPIVHKEMLIMIFDGDNKSERFVTALDKMTGRTLWRTDRVFTPQQLKGMVHSSSTPHVITVEGRDQVVCPGGLGVSAYAVEDGREIWSVKYQAWSVVPRPLYADGLLFICAGVIRPVMLCIDPVGAQGDITDSRNIVWQTSKMVPNMPSPLYVDGRFYTMTSAKLACRRPRTGEVIWNEGIPGQHEASPVYADGHIYLFNKSGGATVVRASERFHLVSTNTLDSGCWASPAVYDRSLIVRTKDHLYRIEDEVASRQEPF